MTILSWRDGFLGPEERKEKQEKIKKEYEEHCQIKFRRCVADEKRRKKEERIRRKIERQAIEKNIENHFEDIIKNYTR